MADPVKPEPVKPKTPEAPPAPPGPVLIVVYPQVNILMDDGTFVVVSRGEQVPAGADLSALQFQITIGHLAAVSAPGH